MNYVSTLDSSLKVDLLWLCAEIWLCVEKITPSGHFKTCPEFYVL